VRVVSARKTKTSFSGVITMSNKRQALRDAYNKKLEREQQERMEEIRFELIRKALREKGVQISSNLRRHQR